MSRRMRVTVHALVAAAVCAAGVAVPTAASAGAPSGFCVGYSDFNFGGLIKHVPTTQYQNGNAACSLSVRYQGYLQGTLVLQEALRYCAGETGLATDGQYGPATQAAVLRFQKAFNASHGGSRITEDGIYGGQTRAALDIWQKWPTYNNGIEGGDLCSPAF